MCVILGARRLLWAFLGVQCHHQLSGCNVLRLSCAQVQRHPFAYEDGVDCPRISKPSSTSSSTTGNSHIWTCVQDDPICTPTRRACVSSFRLLSANATAVRTLHQLLALPRFSANRETSRFEECLLRLTVAGIKATYLTYVCMYIHMCITHIRNINTLQIFVYGVCILSIMHAHESHSR